MKAHTLLPLGSILLLAACGEKKEQAGGGERPPAAVTFVQPIQKKIIAWDEYTGRLEAVEDVEVRARVSGMLESIHFEDGQAVKKGDLLFTIDPKPFKAELDAAEASLLQAKAAHELAKANLQRGRDLLSRNAIAKEEVDIRQGTAAQTEAGVKAAEARVDTARLQLGYTKVHAPIAGRISDRHITEGNLISGGSAQSTLLTTIVSIDPIYCRIEADEASVLRYTRRNLKGEKKSARSNGVNVEMGLSDDQGYPRKGRIDFVNNVFDDATATMRTRAVFENKDSFLVPGMFARVRLPGRGEFTATLVPEIAIQTQQNLTTILTVDGNNTAKPIPVTLGPKHEDMRVIESDLPLDTKVIVSGLNSAFPGAPVQARPAEKQPATRENAAK